MVWSCNKDHWALSRDVEGTSGAYFPEEDVGDHAPEDKRSLVGQARRHRKGIHMVRHADGLVDEG